MGVARGVAGGAPVFTWGDLRLGAALGCPVVGLAFEQRAEEWDDDPQIEHVNTWWPVKWRLIRDRSTTDQSNF